MAKTVRVKITASERVTYNQTRTMDLAEWNRIKKMDPREAAETLGDYLDKHDCDGDGIDEDDFEAEVVDKDGKPVTPRNDYQN